MSKVYKMLELVGTSTASIDDAIKNAIEKSSKTVRNMGWYEVVEIRGAIGADNKVEHQVRIKIGFNVED